MTSQGTSGIRLGHVFRTLIRCLSSLIFRELIVSSSSENYSVLVLVLSLSPNYSLVNVLVLVLVLATNVGMFRPHLRPNFRKGTNNRHSSKPVLGGFSCVQ